MKPLATRFAASHQLHLWLPFLLFGLALLVQPLMARAIPVPSVAIQLVTGDAGEYDAIARSLVAGLGFSYDGIQPTTMRPPLYPAFLAIVFQTLGPDGVIPLQRLMGGGIAVLAFYLGRHLAGLRTGILAGIAVALYPPVQVQAYYWLADSLFTALLLGATLIVLLALKKPSWKRFALAGGTLGLATLTRPTPLLLPLAFLALRGARPKISWPSLAALILGFSLCLAPWLARNWEVTGRLMPVASFGSYNLWQGTFHSNVVYGMVEGMKRDPEFAEAFTRLTGEDHYIDHQAEPRFAQAARDRILADPAAYLWNSFERTIRCWSAFPGTRDWLETRPLLYAAFSLVHLGILALGVVGLLKLPSAPRWALGIVLLYGVAIHASMSLLTRYLIPLMPIFLCLGAVALTARSLPRWEHEPSGP